MKRPRSDRQLRRWYRFYNRRFFANKLPTNISIVYETTDGAYGDCIQMQQGWFRIRINPDLNTGRRSRRFTLIHEMVHVDLWDLNRLHGSIFDTEMQRLAAAGAMKGLW